MERMHHVMAQDFAPSLLRLWALALQAQGSFMSVSSTRQPKRHAMHESQGVREFHAGRGKEWLYLILIGNCRLKQAFKKLATGKNRSFK